MKGHQNSIQIMSQQLKSNDSYISTEIDSFIDDKDETIWICTLSNGLIVYQDDDRPDHEPSAWLRLKEYCKQNNCHVISMKFKFRSHIEHIGDGSEGFFFCRGAMYGIGMKKTEYRYIGGLIKNGKLTTYKFIVPELVLIETENRDIILSEKFIIPCTNLKAETNVPVNSI